MTALRPAAASPRAAALPRSSLYRAIWRWPFFAGPLSAPFLALLAVTGSACLFHGEIEPTAFRYRSVVADPGTAPLSAGALVDRAAASVPGSASTCIDVHQGLAWDLANKPAMLLACLATLFAAVSAPVTWWKRRPRGRVGVPPEPGDARVYRGLWAAAAAFGLAFPVTGRPSS